MLKECRTHGYFRKEECPICGEQGRFLMNEEELDKLEKAMDKLKPEHREVIVLAKIDRLSYKEIGERLSKSADAAGHLLLRAMEALTEAFWTI